MSTELTKQQNAVATRDLFPDDPAMQKMWAMAEAFSKTNLVCPAARGNQANCFYILSLGHDLGISYTHALRACYLTPDGKIGTEGNIIASLLWSKGFKIEIKESTHDRAIVKITRPDGETSFEDSFTIQEAETAGLTKRYNRETREWKEDFSWKAYRKDKLYWRALMRVARRIATDVMFGLHLREELEESIAAEAEFDQTASAPSTEQYVVEEITDSLKINEDDPDIIAERAKQTELKSGVARANAAKEREVQEYLRKQTDDEGHPLHDLAPLPDNAPDWVKPVPRKEVKPGPTLVEQVDAHRALAETECRQMKDEIIKTVGGVTKLQLDDYYVGWFGIKDRRSLPRQAADYLAPLKSLLGVLGKVEESHGWLIEEPKKLGSETRKEYDRVAAGPPRSHVANPHDNRDPAFNLDDNEAFDDPLLTKFGWKNIETAITAQALMVKWKHELPQFESQMRTLRILDLPEPDLLALLKMLYHNTDSSYVTWKRCLDKKLSIAAVFLQIEKEYGGSIGLGSESPKVSKAIATVAGGL